MLTKIEALNYRALRYVAQNLTPFEVLVGPNASGKTTFLDVIAFVADILRFPSPLDAVRERSSDFRDLTWMRHGEWIEFAIEAKVSGQKIPQTANKNARIRYELRLGINPASGELGILAENLWLLSAENGNDHVEKGVQKRLFPDISHVPDRITKVSDSRTPTGWRRIVAKRDSGVDVFRAEVGNWNTSFRLGYKRSALAALPADESRFPMTTWFSEYISAGVQKIMLNSEALRRPSPPQSPRTFLPDGSNLAHVISELEQNSPDRLKDWVQHIRTALPDVSNVKTVERPEDRHRYLVLEYTSGLSAPSWMVSDGTLRMLALTILAYIPNLEGIFLIEEPENGIHPRAVETVLQSLQSVYDAQILLATHSPIILSLAQPEQLLCFARTADGETDVIRGSEHPRLSEWKGEVGLDVLFASGVLG